MWDIWIGKVPVTALMGVLWVFLVVFQLLLCGKAKRLWIRLLPALLCCIPAIAWSLLAAVTPGWAICYWPSTSAGCCWDAASAGESGISRSFGKNVIYPGKNPPSVHKPDCLPFSPNGTAVFPLKKLLLPPGWAGKGAFVLYR